MITRAQQILLKRAQAQAGIEDSDYRTAITDCTGLDDCRSSTDARIIDRHVDVLLAYFEAIYWRKVDAADETVIQRCAGLNAVFRARGYWAGKNTRTNTSRDRYVERDLGAQIAVAESTLNRMGYGFQYCAAIRNKIVPFSLPKYLGALTRTLKSKAQPH